MSTAGYFKISTLILSIRSYQCVDGGNKVSIDVDKLKKNSNLLLFIALYFSTIMSFFLIASIRTIQTASGLAPKKKKATMVDAERVLIQLRSSRSSLAISVNL